MPYVVDGSNVGGRLGGGAGARDRRRVVERLLPWARSGRQVTLVFDGADDGALATSYGGLALRFAGSASADAVILGLVARGPEQWRVVTEDRDLAAACRRRGARVVGVGELLERVERAAAGGEGEGSEDPAVDVEEWEAYFRRRPGRE